MVIVRCLCRVQSLFLVDQFGHAVPMIAFPVRYSVATFFVVACLVRAALQNSVESRYQILAYCLLAATIEIASYATGKGASALRGVLHAVAGTVGVLIVKFLIEA
jgi:hypothetical protein